MTDCIFCKIARGEIPTEIILENEEFLAFKDITPKAPIHVLIITRKHYPNLAQVTGGELEAFPGFLRALEQELGISTDGYRLIVNTGKHAGQVVFHLHLHLIAGEFLGDIV